jgi:hypothetical protein
MGRTYYQGPDAMVTDRVFVHRTTPEQTFAVAGLRRPGITRGDLRRSRSFQVRTAVVGLAVAFLSTLLAEWLFDSLPAVFGAALAVTGVVALGWRAWWARRRRWELWATYRGTEVLLYATSDEGMSHQVTRALRRAIEDSRPGPEEDGDREGGPRS